MKIDKKIIKELSDYLEEFNLTELEYTEKDTKIKVSKNNVVCVNAVAFIIIPSNFFIASCIIFTSSPSIFD